MKIRIRDNSVRLRLARGEVETLRHKRIVSASTHFPGQQEFRYMVESNARCSAPTASFADGKLTICLPETAVLDWITSEQVSVRGAQDLDDGGVLQILVEKDFACLQPRDSEDESDMYPNPDIHKAEC